MSFIGNVLAAVVFGGLGGLALRALARKHWRYAKNDIVSFAIFLTYGWSIFTGTLAAVVLVLIS